MVMGVKYDDNIFIWNVILKVIIMFNWVEIYIVLEYGGRFKGRFIRKVGDDKWIFSCILD